MQPTQDDFIISIAYHYFFLQWATTSPLSIDVIYESPLHEVAKEV